MDRIQLFCFPYAGGSAMIFNEWQRYLDPTIQLIPVELAGRGRRIHEPFYKDVKEVVEDVFWLMREFINRSPYAFFGHSMGSLISYELAQKIRNYNFPDPSHIFFSGGGAPHVKRKDKKKYHLMNDTDFKKEVIGLGGTPPELFEHPELMELFIPLLKNDFKIAETETSTSRICPLNSNITVFLGKEDDLTLEQCEGWKKHTLQTCNIHYFNGGHFFLHNETKKVVEFINNTFVENICS